MNAKSRRMVEKKRQNEDGTEEPGERLYRMARDRSQNAQSRVNNNIKDDPSRPNITRMKSPPISSAKHKQLFEKDTF